MPREIPDELVEVAARAVERSLTFMGTEGTRMPGTESVDASAVAQVVLSAVSEAGWVSKDQCDRTHAMDLQAVLDADGERDEARAQAEVLREKGREFADWLERDRREPDKVLCVVQSMRRAYRESQEADHAA